MASKRSSASTASARRRRRQASNPTVTLTIKGEKTVRGSFKVTKELSVSLPFVVSEPTSVRLSLGRGGLLTVKVPLEARAAAPEATKLEVEVLADGGDGESAAAGANKATDK